MNRQEVLAKQREILGLLRKRNRLGSRAVRIEYNGTTYDSRAEAERAMELDHLLAVGEIRAWTHHVGFHLGPDHRYTVDFLVVEKTGTIRVEDVKGAETERFRKTRSLWAKYGVCALHVRKRRGTEIVDPCR